MTSNDELLYELTWVHVSDIHETGLRGAEEEHRRLVFQRLLEDLDQRSDIRAPDPTIVVVTGDIAMTGGAQRPNEYTEAARFIRSLTDRLGPGSKLLIVPGNHDTRRAAADDAPTLRMLRAARDGDERLDDLLVRAQDSEMLERRVSGYHEFLASLSDVDPEVGSGSVITGWSRIVNGRSLSVKFVGLNTALLANDDNDKGKLQLGYTQLRTATEDASAGILMILLTHHPVDWLGDGDAVTPVLTEYFDLHLYGHLHLPKSYRDSLLQRKGLISIGAGATYHGLSGTGIGAGEYSYSICSLGWNRAGRLMLRVWPRIWSGRAARWGADHAILDPGADFGTYPIIGYQRAPGLTGSSEGVNAWLQWSSRTVRSFGNRRTAYPLDLTIRELFEREISIQARVKDLAVSHNVGGGQALSETAITGSSHGKATLILGEPGTGKSVAAYELTRALSSMGVIPIILRASEFKALLSPGHEYAEVMKTALGTASSWDAKLALVIDGIDEMSGSSNSITLAGEFILTAANVMRVIVTCRRREFEDEISRWIPDATFDQILSVKEWSVDDEFNEYVRRLVAARLLRDTDIWRVVNNSPSLRKLAERPLFARMLTYVGVEDSGDVKSATSLYDRYLNSLASSCASSLAGPSVESVDPMKIWRTAAQITFENALIIDEELSYSAVELLLSKETGISVFTIRRTMAYILDIRERGSVRFGQFVHYSFLEFLVASSIFDHLVVDKSIANIEAVVMRFRYDLPRRVRHFLTNLLRSSNSEVVGSLLSAAYTRARDMDLRPPVRRIVCNLIAYVVSRSFPDESHLLEALLSEENDPFLRNSLFWAICHVGDPAGAVSFIRELDSSVSRRQMNRGYLLYYHGDLSRDLEPPFMDSPPLRTWSFTRGEVLEMMTDSQYQSTVSPPRQAIDLYTFFDFCIARGEVNHGRDGTILRKLVDDLWESGNLPAEVGSRLLAQVAICTDVE